MINALKSKPVATLLIFSIILLYSPHFLKARDSGTGSLIGFVYDKDGTTPLEGAVVKLRSVSNAAVHESGKTDKLGIFTIEGIEEGLYVLGVSSEKGDFNAESFVGIRAGETATVSVALKPIAQTGGRVTKECPRGDWYVPEVEGECDEGYKWNAEKKRCECIKRKGLAAFFLSPAGILVILAATGGIVYGIVKLTEEEEEVSPFRKK